MDVVNSKALLFGKLLKIQTAIKSVGKDGVNNFHKYKYSTASDVLAICREASSEVGIVLVCDVVESSVEPGKASVKVRLAAYDADTGESTEIFCPGYAEDFSHKDNKVTGDKALYKAITGATKYAFRSLFCLPSDDDPEKDSKHSDSSYSSQQAPKPQTTTQAPKSINQPLLSPDEKTGKLINAVGEQVKRLGWETNQAQDFISMRFNGKKSRSALNDSELEQLLTELKSMPVRHLQPV